jgi:antitoxin MazE
MGTSIKTRIIKIGNSQGIRIPKILLNQAEIGEDVELEVQGHNLVIRPARGLRHGWDEKFAQMAEHHDDQLLDADAISTSSWDTDEWEW